LISGLFGTRITFDELTEILIKTTSFNKPVQVKFKIYEHKISKLFAKDEQIIIKFKENWRNNYKGSSYNFNLGRIIG
jgi:hypothetical protein